MKLRNPLIDRSPGPPLRLTTRAARWGALAVFLGGSVLALPLVQGYRAGLAGEAVPSRDSAWGDLRHVGWEMARGAAAE